MKTTFDIAALPERDPRWSRSSGPFCLSPLATGLPTSRGILQVNIQLAPNWTQLCVTASDAAGKRQPHLTNACMGW